jgi:hypothetical protein
MGGAPVGTQGRDDTALGDFDVSGMEGCTKMSNIDPKTVFVNAGVSDHPLPLNSQD